MPNQQFDLFDVVVNVAPGLAVVLLAVPFLPAQLLELPVLQLELSGAGISALVLVLSYLLGELFYGIARQRLPLRVYDGFESALDWVPLVGGPSTDPEYDQTFQEYVALALEEGAAPSLNEASVERTLALAEAYYGLTFLVEDDSGGYETRNLGQLYYLTRSDLTGRGAISLRFETEANLFLTLWFVFALAAVAHLLMIVAYALLPDLQYTTVWYRLFGTAPGPTAAYVGLLVAGAVVCVLRRNKYREKQVKSLVYDLYVHLNERVDAESAGAQSDPDSGSDSASGSRSDSDSNPDSNSNSNRHQGQS